VRVVGGQRVVDMPAHDKSDDQFARTHPRPSQFPMPLDIQEIETPNGLMDCSVWFYFPQSCESTTLGKKKAHRQWVVKVKGQWYRCNGRAAPQQCISMARDGVLRFLPRPSLE